jgi:hypothetical protein
MFTKKKPLIAERFFCGESKASLTEYLEKNKEKLVLLRFDYAPE